MDPEQLEQDSAFQSALGVLKDIHGGDEALYEQISRSWQRLKTAAWRGGAAGLTLRGGLNVLSTLLFMLRMATRGKGKARPKRGLTLPEAVNDTLRYTAFLAALGGSYVAVDEGLAILLGKSRTAKWRALVAGAVAGHTLLLTGRDQRHHSLATYILLRGLTLLVRTGNKPDCQQRHPLLHALLAPTRMAHGDTALMCLASSQIIYSFIVMPTTLPPSYARFIDKIAGKESFVWHGAREQALRNIRKEPLGPLKALQDTPFKHCTSAVPCEFWHPGQTCAGHAVGILPHAYARALGIYLPVYLVPALLVHRQKLLKRPLVLLPKVAAGVGRSALFLSSYIALTFGGVCAGFSIFGASSGMSIATCVWIAGFATLLEKKSRRMELALYCLSRAAESYCRCLVAWGVVSRKSVPTRLDVVLFAAGCAAITHCYSDDRGRHRDVFRSKYLNVLDFIFGNTGVNLGAIKHLPSNRDMVAQVSKTIRSFSAQRLSAMAGQASSQAAPATEAPCNAQDALAPPNHTHKNAEVRSAVAAVPLRGVQSQADAAASEAAGANPAVSAGMPAVNVCPGAADALAAQAAAATAAANLEAHAWRRRVECGGVGGGERWARELGSARAVSSRCAEEQGLGLGRGVGPTSTAGAVHGVQGGDADADDAQASCRWAAAAAAAAAGLSPAEAAGAHVVQGVSPSAGDFGHAQGVQKNVTVYEADGAPCGAYAQQHTQLQACAPDGGVQGAPTPSSHPVSSCLSGGPSVERSQSALQASEQGAPTPSSHPVSSCLSGGPSAVSVEWSQSASQASGQGVLHQLHHNNGEARSQCVTTHSHIKSTEAAHSNGSCLHADSEHDAHTDSLLSTQQRQQQQQQQQEVASNSSLEGAKGLRDRSGAHDQHTHGAYPTSTGASGRLDGEEIGCEGTGQGHVIVGGKLGEESESATGDDAAGGQGAEGGGEQQVLMTETGGDGQAEGEALPGVSGGGGSKKAAKKARKKGGKR